MKELEPTDESFAEIEAAGRRLIEDLHTVNDLAAPTLLPGWSRAHLLSHLAAQVTALERLFTWARTGIETPQYAGRSQRDAEIEAGSHRSRDELLRAVETAAAQFLTAARELPAFAWSAAIRPFTGETATPKRLLTIRLRELEIHHVDLDLGYTFARIPPIPTAVILADATQLLERTSPPAVVLLDERGEVVHEFGTGGPTVQGPRGAMLAWLTGRSSGHCLRSTSTLPTLPSWI